MINKRNSTVTALLTSYDTYDDLLGKANKGIEFYSKLETNVSKLLQRVRSACKVQEEEREQMLAKAITKTVEPAVSTAVSSSGAPKLRDYLDCMKKDPGQYTVPAYPGGMEPSWSPGVRPAPLGSEMNVESALPVSSNEKYGAYTAGSVYNQATAGYVPGGVPYSPAGGSAFGYGYGGYADQQYPSSYQQQGPSLGAAGSHQQQLPTVSASPQLQTYPQQLPAQQQSYSQQQQQATFAQQVPTAAQHLPTVAPYSQQSSLPQPISTYSQQFPPVPQPTSVAPQQFPTVSQPTFSYQQPDLHPTPPPPQQAMVSQAAPLPTVQTFAQQTPAAAYPYASQSPLPAQDKDLDDVLSERMAALLSTKKRTSEYPVNQYAQFGYNPQTTPTYSSTNYSYPAITQAYTITSAYQQVPSASPRGEYSTSSSGYATTVSESGNYSVPPPSSTPQYSVAQPVAAFPEAYSGAGGSYTNYIPQSYAAPSMPASGVNSMSYSANAYNGQQGYYQGYQSTDSGASSQPYVYGSLDQNGQYGGSEQSYPTGYYSQSSAYPDHSTAVYTQAGTSGYYGYYQDSVTTTTAGQYGAPQGNPPQSEASSNVDLLSGLDFSVNQVPLTPQPTKSGSDVPGKPEEAKVEPAMPAAVRTSKQDEEKKLDSSRPQIKLLELPKRNLLENPETFKLFVQESEKFEKFVDTLTTKTLNGPTTLEVKWKEITDKQDADMQKRSISVARCYPMKNRSPDILPYDYSRVELVTTKDDYINASHIRDITPYTPPFIVTQCPMTATIADFWTLVWEQQVEMVACLLSESQVSLIFGCGRGSW